ncbi:MAG: PKD domain-containing protein [Candidatus Zixiibacteriota bacterium]
MKSKLHFLSRVLRIALIVVFVSTTVDAEQLSQSHDPLGKSYTVLTSDWGYDSGWQCLTVLTVGGCGRIVLKVGGEYLHVWENGNGTLNTATEELWFTGTNGQLSQNFGIEFGAQAKLTIFGNDYPISLPLVPYFDFLLTGNTNFAPYRLGQSVVLTTSIPRTEVACAEVDLAVASGGVCLDGAAGSQITLTGQQIQTSAGTYTYNGQHNPISLNCPSNFSVSNIRKQWGYNGTVTLSAWITPQISVFLIGDIEIPIQIFADWPIPYVDQIVAGSFVTDPARNIPFSIPCRSLSLNKDGEGKVKVDGVTKSLPWSGSFPKDYLVSLQASEVECYTFIGWTGDISGYSPNQQVTMSSNKNATLHFDFDGVGQPNISGLPSSVCGGSQHNLSAPADGATDYDWSSSCGGTFSSPHSSVTVWTAPSSFTGSCTIEVEASNDCDSKSDDALTTVKQKPGTPTITGPSQVCGGQGEQYSATATGNPTSWNWTSSCGGTFNPQNSSTTTWTPPLGYTGSCQITVTASNTCGDTDGSKQVTVTDCEVRADFAANDSSGCVPLSIEFTDASTGNIQSWLWRFGDGDSSQDQNPTYTYADTGCFDVTLIVTGESEADSTTKACFISALGPPGKVEMVSGSEISACVDQEYCIVWNQVPTASSYETRVNGGSWTPVGNETQACDTIRSAGTYTYVVRARNQCGPGIASEMTTVSISECPVTAEFVGSEPRSGIGSLNVTFTDQSYGSPPPNEWHWDFGNGQEATDQGPHDQDYGKPGSYDVSLIVRNGTDSDTITKPDYVRVFFRGTCVLDPSSLDLGIVQVGDKDSASFSITNTTPQSLLVVTSVTGNHASLTLQKPSLPDSIDTPDDPSRSITVLCQPSDDEAIAGTITIATNAGDYTIPVKANSGFALFFDVLDLIMKSESIPQDMAAHLDEMGNGNGEADIGDLMIILRGASETPKHSQVVDENTRTIRTGDAE